MGKSSPRFRESGRIDIPAETAQNRLIGRTLRLGESFDGERIEES